MSCTNDICPTIPGLDVLPLNVFRRPGIDATLDAKGFTGRKKQMSLDTLELTVCNTTAEFSSGSLLALSGVIGVFPICVGGGTTEGA
jgi:hypothetical protein